MLTWNVRGKAGCTECRHLAPPLGQEEANELWTRFSTLVGESVQIQRVAALCYHPCGPHPQQSASSALAFHEVSMSPGFKCAWQQRGGADANPVENQS